MLEAQTTVVSVFKGYYYNLQKDNCLENPTVLLFIAEDELLI